MINSDYRFVAMVKLPFAARQRYMHSFDIAAPVMAEGFHDYLDTVQTLLKAVGATSGVAHMTVDEKVIEAGMSQRRPKPHIDGCFMPAEMRWGGHPGWNHGCNDIASERVSRMPVIVAASEIGCRVWRGQFDTQPSECGDLSHISDQLGTGYILPPNSAYLLNADCIHESMIQERPTQRTFLRIALPTGFRC